METISRLKQEIGRKDDPFVWSVIDQACISAQLPRNIKSTWIFVLKEGVPSGSHYHSNNVQHMVVVEGRGQSNVGGQSRRMIEFGSPDHSPEDIWFVIEEGEEHEFLPKWGDMVVISFHTCEAHELEEIACGTGQSRRYEGER